MKNETDQFTVKSQNYSKEHDLLETTIIIKRALSTAEVTIRINKDVCTGDIIEYGEWRDLDNDELEKYVKVVEKYNEQTALYGGLVK